MTVVCFCLFGWLVGLVYLLLFCCFVFVVVDCCCCCCWFIGFLGVVFFLVFDECVRELGF